MTLEATLLSKYSFYAMLILLIEDNDEISEAMAFYCGAKKDIDRKVTNSGHEGSARRNLILFNGT